MTGIEMIAKERQEQIDRHGFTNDKDKWYLISLAQYIMMEDDDAEKDNLGEYLFGEQKVIDKKWRKKFDNKSPIERLVVAGALIAAEIDRLSEENSGE